MQVAENCSHHAVVVKGGLTSVLVKGMHNEVYIDRLEEVTIDGEHNKISYKSTPDKKEALKSTIVQGSMNNKKKVSNEGDNP